MEYYTGYLMPVRMPVCKPKPCGQARRVKRSLQREINNLQSRVRSMEGKFIRTRERSCRSLKSGFEQQYRMRQPGRIIYRTIQNEYYDYNTQEENRMLREENKLLNQYFELFNMKRQESANELYLLRKENAKLKKAVSKEAKSSQYEIDSPKKVNVREVEVSTRHFCYDKPPYLSPYLTPQVEVNNSDLGTKANYEDSSMDVPRVERSILKTVRSGML